ncbi:type III secretion system needle filament subunit SctF [Pseudomonas chlororaphis]|uniref:type III secretion system needle filament subunit SctF n=1 Tax=Pseudomonas chlororaphis TaxID=587753 RepID=UPI0015E008BF|nr:type III secretion system needle filament subunit SctF [Pseudomonas chlororaphis]QLL13458.1 type III secretion system needle filament subunit SctF [Pseudomonas chlororaphis subsp. aurantiaca]
MEILSIVNQLSQMIDKVGQDVQSKMSSEDLNDPAKMLQVQFAVQQYTNFVNFESAIMKSVKDMMAGIIQKI